MPQEVEGTGGGEAEVVVTEEKELALKETTKLKSK